MTEMTDIRYPVLYLLHGQTYTQDQWIRLGVPQIADELIHDGESVPFIIVFPDDHYWNADPGDGFGDRLIFDIIPYLDKNYRTLADREHRSLGGLSRGGGWAVKLGFEHPELFGSLGLAFPGGLQGQCTLRGTDHQEAFQKSSARTCGWMWATQTVNWLVFGFWKRSLSAIITSTNIISTLAIIPSSTGSACGRISALVYTGLAEKPAVQ